MQKIFVIITFSLLLSCAKDASKEDTRKFNSENEWIYDIMKNNYLYRDDMPVKPDYLKSSVDFFYSLLSKKDGSIHSSPFSYIEERVQTRSVSLKSTNGIKLSLYRLSDKNIHFARILYCYPGSPSYNSGLERGDYIVKVNKEFLNGSNLTNLISGESTELSIVKNRDINLSELFNPDIATEVTIRKSETIAENPIFLYKTIEQNGKRIGYLVYNHFTSGIGEDSSIDKRYNDELCQISNVFASNNITELVLDLRYNGGGELDAAQVLATILAPQSILGNIFCILKDVNGNIQPKYRFDSNRIKTGTNLNLQRLFVLTTNSTASASELIINSLRPYMDVIIIGDTTVGKNVGSVSYKHEKYPYKLRPITHFIYNKNMEANYSEGFKPNYEVVDYTANRKMFNLGDHNNEPLLKSALEIINGKTYKNATTKSTDNTGCYKIRLQQNTDLIIN